MDIEEADGVGNAEIDTLSTSPPEVRPYHVWDKIEAIESSNRAALRLPPSLHRGISADGRVLPHSQRGVDEDIDGDEHECSDVESCFIPETADNLFEEADGISNFHGYESDDADQIRSPGSVGDDLQWVGEGPMLDNTESDGFDPGQISARRQAQFEEAGESTYSDEHDGDDYGDVYSAESPEDRPKEAEGSDYSDDSDQHKSDDSDPVYSPKSLDEQQQGIANIEPAQIPQSPSGQSEDGGPTVLSHNDLMEEVSDYLQHSMLQDVYGDLLSSPP